MFYKSMIWKMFNTRFMSFNFKHGGYEWLKSQLKSPQKLQRVRREHSQHHSTRPSSILKHPEIPGSCETTFLKNLKNLKNLKPCLAEFLWRFTEESRRKRGESHSALMCYANSLCKWRPVETVPQGTAGGWRESRRKKKKFLNPFFI